MKTATSQAGQGHGAPQIPDHELEIYAERMKSFHAAYDFARYVVEPAFFHQKEEYRLPCVMLGRVMHDEIHRLALEAQQVGALLLIGVRS